MTGPAELDRKILAAAERLGRALRAARQQVATRHHVSLLQLQVLERLRDGRSRRVGELAAELDVTQPTVSDAIATLCDKGLTTRERDPSDGRATTIALTGVGRTVADDAAVALAPLLDGGVAAGEADRATTLRVLLAEIARLQDAGLITVNRSCLSCHHFQPPAGPAPARCLLLDRPLPDRDLRVDCDDHQARIG